ncbi:MAG: hypothetical protein NC430_07255 [bacterium]|nr:hypothetical protein [bacterium]MCM1423623.1 hypothetical protein [bacterium]
MKRGNIFLRKWFIKLFRLNEWHYSGHDDKEYAQYAVRMINNLIEREGKPKGKIVEIGCGLGDIIGYIKLGRNKKTGLDLEQKVVYTAGVLHPNTQFRKGSFADVRNQEIYCLIIINLLHFIEPEYAKAEIKKILESNKVEYVVIDELRDTENSSYRYECHGEEMLGGQYVPCYRSKRINAAEGANRHIIVYRKNNRR